ncbi:MAG: zinc ABC transporter substrate-binding protein [Campylobacterota bacterium]|nr:zinc ABC transporter substrate-binding protein [Campylobacterota bacterium]
MKFFITLIALGLGLYANTNVAVSIAPQKSFVKSIGGDKVDVILMVKAGKSPHTYEPLPSQMRDISKADVYFSIGVEFESVWLKRFKSQNRSMKIVDVSTGIKKIPILSRNNHDYGSHDPHEYERLDPHVWTTPNNIKIIAQNIYDELVKLDPKNTPYYKKNLDNLLNSLTRLNSEIKEILSNVKYGTKFMVFHPSWGYFAHDFHLEQLAIEIGGKSPKPKSIIKILDIAKKESISAIFAQPEFSQKSAKIISNELGIDVILVSPLNPNYRDNLIKMATSIAQ